MGSLFGSSSRKANTRRTFSILDEKPQVVEKEEPRRKRIKHRSRVGGSSVAYPSQSDQYNLPRGLPFTPDLDVCAYVDRNRPHATWSAHGLSITRSTLVFRSRRMCHQSTELLVAVHLIDDKPTPLLGRVKSCAYDGNGTHIIVLDLEHIPDISDISDWLDAR